MLRWLLLALAGWLAFRWLRAPKPAGPPPRRGKSRLDPDRAVPARWSEVKKEEGADR